MRPDQGRAWRKAGRNGREGRQVITPRLREAIAYAREAAELERALADGSVVRFTWDRSEFTTLTLN